MLNAGNLVLSDCYHDVSSHFTSDTGVLNPFVSMIFREMINKVESLLYCASR